MQSQINKVTTSLKNNEPHMIFQQPFSQFHNAGEYGGIKLTKRLLKNAVFAYMLTREDYFQASFQYVYDEGIQADHTHKFADVIHTQGWRGKTMTASYTIMSQKGLVCCNRLTYTKGNEELRQLIQDIKECRTVSNAGPLKVFSSDCLNLDGSLWKTVFPELNEGVVPYQPIDNNLPMLGIDPDSFIYLDTASKMNATALAIMNDYPEGERIIYGLDTECCWGENGVRLMQVSFPPVNGVEQKVHLFDFNAANIGKENFPTRVKQMLLRSDFIPTGRAIGTDCTRLHDTMGVRIQCWIELRTLALALFPTLTATGLADLVRFILKANLDKDGQRGDYSKIPLPYKLKLYAALDAYVSRRLYEILASKLPSPYSDIIYKGPDVCSLDQIRYAELYLGGKTVAKCSIIYVGQKGSLETRKWGKTTVTPGKVLVRIDEVWHQNVHPPMSYVSNEEGVPSWKKGEVVLQDLLGQEILVNISQLVITVCGVEGTVTGDFLQRSATNNSAAHDSTVDNNSTIESNKEDPFLVFLDNLENTFDCEEDYRSRQKEDIFHQFKILLDLISKKEPLRNTISRLVIHATFIFHDEDFSKIEDYLQRIKGFDQNDSGYLQKVMDHFYFNREWWREHCRMYIAKSENHAARLQKVVQAMKTDPELAKLLTPEVQQYFENFIVKALKGEFEEQDDVVLFIKRGEDAHGLPLYYRLRGTVRTENLHQKMKAAIGPWNVGPQTAHMMLVLICYRYNVKTRIKRCGANNFGHCELYYIDRIQNRLQEIFNVLAWPRHVNQSLFRGKKDMTSVGIGPLTYDPKYVEQSDEPAPCLKGDRWFMAKQMRLKYPILHIGSIAEIKIFNEFMKTHTLTAANLRKLAEIYKNMANGIDVFYKLPSMLKSYAKTWAKNSDIQVKEQALVSSITILMGELFCTRMSEEICQNMPPTIAAKNMAVQNDLNQMRVSVEREEENNERQLETATQLFVGGFQATDQRMYIPSNFNLAPVPISERRCAWFPDCQKPQAQCGGYKKELCIDFKHQIHNNDFIEENKRKKDEYDKKKKALKAREKRKEVKRRRLLELSSTT